MLVLSLALAALPRLASAQPQPPDPSIAGDGDPTFAFLSRVLGSTESVWVLVLGAQGATVYPAPALVLYTDETASPCGRTLGGEGPYYCSIDQTIYLDPEFYVRLATEFGAPGDFAYGYVVAHEVGHHIQYLLGVMPEFAAAKARLDPRDGNRLSVLFELQADCYAGIWGHYLQAAGMLDPGDLEEGLTLAYQLGDDTLQMRLTGKVLPEAMDHGTSALRMAWFRQGFDVGTLEGCQNPDFDVAMARAAALARP